MATERTLILMDTNKIRNVIDGSPRYDSFEFGKEFNELRDYIIQNKLDEQITLAITEMTLKELLDQKKKSFEEDLKSLNSSIQRLKHLENVTIPEITLPPSDFDCISYLSPKVTTFLQDNKIELIRIEENTKSKVFDILIEKVIAINPPFREGKNKSCSGQGFKDAVIFETFKHSTYPTTHQNLFLLTSDGDFDGCDINISGVNFKISKSKELLIQELNSIYSDLILTNKYESILTKDYFKENLKEFVASELSTTADQIEIVGSAIKITENKEELMTQFSSLIEGEDYFEDMIGLKFRVKTNGKEYQMNSLYDTNTNEIDNVQIEEAFHED